MRGIGFTVSNGENILRTIFTGVACEKYWWNITEEEIYDKMDKPLFAENYINGKTFVDTISNQNHHVIFANIKAYPPNTSPTELETYEDFIKSDCQLNLLCVDVIYYEIYSKDDFVIETIRSNASKNGFHNVEYITEENDGRTRFSVW
ncbi:DUF2691 family protein [Desulfosporosinus sp. SYSU MS00001]|uniref:DUF2691 family protein n=1 Tax=Desulfosporosinus sp. SYSU MS00001 TaxID=3416284 RepID=UPI003CEF2959